jgi:hypothetical protein
MTNSNYILDLFHYTKEVVLKGWEWQYKDVNGNGKQPKLFFSSFQKLAIVLSIGFIFYSKDKTAFDDNFINYLITSFSIFIGLFITILVMFFDKHSILKKPTNNENEQVIYNQSRNFFCQFTYLTSYNIFIAVLLVSLLVLPLLFKGFNVPISKLFQHFCSEFNKKEPHILDALKLLIYALHKSLVIYFILDFLSLTVFSISSFTKHSITNFERNNPEQ